jgi:hypothetical protein
VSLPLPFAFAFTFCLSISLCLLPYFEEMSSWGDDYGSDNGDDYGSDNAWSDNDHDIIEAYAFANSLPDDDNLIGLEILFPWYGLHPITTLRYFFNDLGNIRYNLLSLVFSMSVVPLLYSPFEQMGQNSKMGP